MTSINVGNNNPTAGDDLKEYTEHQCPFCKKTVKRLPAHLPCEGYDD